MRYCAKCGFQNDDSGSFCTKCGAILSFQTAPAPTAQNANPMSATYGQPAVTQIGQIKPAVESHEVIAEMKKIGSSPLMLAGALCLTLTLVINILSGFFNSGAISSLLSNSFQSLGYSSYYAAKASAMVMGYAIIAVFIAAIPSALYMIAVWITYSSCKNITSSFITTAGLTIVKVLNVIFLVGLYLMLILIELALILSMIGTGFSGYRINTSFIGAVIAALIIGGVFALFITYYTKLVKTVDVIKSCAISGLASDYVSKYVIVINYLIAAGGIFGSIFSFIKLDVYSGTTAILSAAATIIFTIILTHFRDSMSFLMIKNAKGRAEAIIDNPVQE